jgi:hypothetical protein
MMANVGAFPGQLLSALVMGVVARAPASTTVGALAS